MDITAVKAVIERLCAENTEVKSIFGGYVTQKELDKTQLVKFERILGWSLLNPAVTIQLGTHVRPWLLEILGQLCKNVCNITKKAEQYNAHRALCVALSKLLTVNADVARIVQRYFENSPAPFEKSEVCEPSSKKIKLVKESEVPVVTDLDVIQATYNLLVCVGDFMEMWNWNDLLEFLKHSSPSVRWLTCNCIALLSKMSEEEREKLIRKHLSKEESFQDYFLKHGPGQPPPLPSVLEDGTVTHNTRMGKQSCMIGGIALPLYESNKKAAGCLVELQSTENNLRATALAIARGRPVLLEGVVGSGKTSVIEHLAHLTGRIGAPYLTKVQLGDQTDSKTLLGTYRCTTTPGEFIWQPGSLTKAVTEGYWLLLEDIDSAPMDVVSILVPLLESRTLHIPGHGNKCAHPDFQLFATRRIFGSGSRMAMGSAALLDKLWSKVSLETLSRTELEELVKTMYPKLTTIADKLVKTYLMLSAGHHGDDNEILGDIPEVTPSKASGRLVSTRDLMKWCSRITKHIDTENKDLASRAFQEAVDCFCCAVPEPTIRFEMAEHIGSYMNKSKAEVDYYCNKYKPDVEQNPQFFKVGKRAKITRNKKQVLEIGKVPNVTFSFTRQSACLLERITVAVSNREPVLIIGETGTGKTSTVQYLAHQTRNKLKVINMNQQSDSTDLLGGFKPMEMKMVVAPLRQEFEDLFSATFSSKQNSKFLKHIMTTYTSKQWDNLFTLMSHSQSKALEKLTKQLENLAITCNGSESQGNEKDEVELLNGTGEDKAEVLTELVQKWKKLKIAMEGLAEQVKTAQSALAFTFMEGTLVKAIQEGEWVLLDEINLASAETLECLSGLLESSHGSLTLLERGDDRPIQRHPNFRLFACMNPATDVGKKELPAGLRNRFTEYYMEELDDHTDLMILIHDYLVKQAPLARHIKGIKDFYIKVKKEASALLIDGTGNKPHFSLRTLCRALRVTARNECGSFPRSLYESFCLAFLTQVDRKSHLVVKSLIKKYLLEKEERKLVTGPIPKHKEENTVHVAGYWIPKGELELETPEKYIVTETVKQNLADLVRIVSLGRFPVLLQGETSVGKTSLIMYLAQLSGNACVRINNHEHTDLQEYIGSYGPDESGKLVFKEGVLVKAMRRGHWIVLDELNLAPTDVLEALNRLLDDNRELLIPETQEMVKAHPRFMLFATQNPPGLYGGRKILSRAFRNRFVELHFDEIPPPELEVILHKRSEVPLSYSKKMVAVLHELQNMRRESNLFQGKHSFVTLRDLFRWAERYRLAGEQTEKFYDWDQHLADEGYIVMAGRVRMEEEAEMIKQVLAKRLKRKVNKENLFSLGPNTSSTTKALLEQMSSITGFENVVWTQDMRRLYILVSRALRFKEPVLLVGETGCGKTTVCQMLAAQEQQTLYTVNCHMHTEGTDLLGGLRPVRTRRNEKDDRLFEWVDGPLILSMRSGGMFLADEISLADDSVLERLNSVLEPERTLLLAEKGTDDGYSNPEIIVAHDQFRLIGTMNPGGDYGKKELSPALRNRFTEIWCPKVEIGRGASDVISIINHNLQKGIRIDTENTKSLGGAMLQFLEHFTSTELGKKCTLSIRDLLSWVLFINKVTSDTIGLDPGVAFIHGACLVLLDGLGSGHTGSGTTAWQDLKKISLKHLTLQVEKMMGKPVRNALLCEEEVQNVTFVSNDKEFGIKPFLIPKGSVSDSQCKMFTFKAPRTCINLIRLLRGLQLNHPVLLEGSPGVGKTSLVIALAKAAGHDIIRINLSEQTDVSDLFGADLPVEGGEGGRFAWRDGPFLQALRSGAWIVLDELNLASQSVLEGLNACFDHRGEVFIPELGRTFTIEHKTTKIFACQNPQYQGGARKGLPRSFLNRFTQVYIEPLSAVDLEFIISMMYQELPQEIVMRMVAFNNALTTEILEQNLWGQLGGPWELNLRDMFRWCEIMLKYQKPEEYNPGEYVGLIYSDRMRTIEDKERVIVLYDQIFGQEYPGYTSSCRFHVSKSLVQSGHAFIPRQINGDEGCDDWSSGSLCLLQHQIPVLESLITCINMNWMAILVGESGVGKTSVVKFLSRLTGRQLRVVTVNSDMDVTELLGGFEQVDHGRVLGEVVTSCGRLLRRGLRRSLLQSEANVGTATPSVLLQAWWDLKSARQHQGSGSRSSKEEAAHFLHTCRLLRRVLDLLQQQQQALTTSSAEFDEDKPRKTPKKERPGEEKLEKEEEEAEAQDLKKTDTKRKKKRKKKMSLDESEGLSPLPKNRSDSRDPGEVGREEEEDKEEQADGEQDEFKELRRKVKEVEGRVKRSGLVTGGGTFVWVDSILVKSIQEGCWLLLDGVNACSASVLDRLNGLLEPGGALTMQERGAVGGEVPTIRPHPDFRLILALDPRHGEISRAMRNRGLEIFMPGGRWESPQDLRNVMLLRGAVGANGGLGGGAGGPLAQHALLGAHNAVAQLLPSYQQPGIGDLTLAASVSAQLLSAGKDLQHALSDALHLVYVRSRGKKAEQGVLTEAVEAAVTSSASAFPVDITWPPYQELTLSSAVVSIRGSRVVGVRQAAYLLHTLLVAAARPDHASLWGDSPLPPSCQVPDPGPALVPALVHTLAFTPVEDWQLVRQWCAHLLSTISGVPKNLREIIRKSLQQAAGGELVAPARSLKEVLREGVCGVDPRHNAQGVLALLGRDPEQLQNLSSLANKVLLWLRRIATVAQLEDVEEEEVMVPRDRKTSADTLTLLQVSSKIEKKLLGADAVAHPSVVHLAPLLTQVDDLLDGFVRDNQIRLTDEEWLRLVLALKWRDRLQSFCSRTVKKAAFHMFLPRLALHWQWLHEELLQKIPDTWRTIVPEKLMKTVARLQDVFSAHCGVIHKTATSLRNTIGHPAPFADAKTAQAYTRARNMDKLLTPAITAHALNRFLASEDATEAKGKLLQMLCMEWDPVREEADLHEQFVNLEEFFSYHNVNVYVPASVGVRALPCPGEDDDEDDDNENLDLKIQVWPLQDYVACLQHAWGRVLASEGKTAAAERAMEGSRVSPSVSMTHLAFYKRDKSKEVPLYWRRVLSQIATHTYNLLSNSTATRRPAAWRTYSSAPKDDDDGCAAEEVHGDSIYSLGSCLLSHILTCGAKYSTSEIEDIAVAQHVEKAQQLEEVRATLWSNWKELTSSSYSYEEAFAQYVVDYTTGFFSSLASALHVSSEQNIVRHSLFSVVPLTKGIREACERLPPEAVWLLDGVDSVCQGHGETENLEEKVTYSAQLAVLVGGLQASILSHMQAVDPAQQRQLLLGYREEEARELEAELCVYAWLETVRGSQLEKVPPRLVHPHVDLLTNAKAATLSEVEVLSQEVAHRPDPPEYDSLQRDVSHFTANVFKLEKLIALKEEIDTAHRSRQPSSGLLTRIDGFLLSCDNFVKQTSQKYPLYCDLVYPLLQAVCVTCEGLRLLKAKLVLRQVEHLCEGVNSRRISETMSLFAAFPVPREPLCPTKVIEVQMTSLKGITSMLSAEEYPGLGRLCHSLGVRSVLIDTYNAAVTQGCLTPSLRRLLESVLSALAHAWRQQEEERKRKEEEEESLYKFKPRTLADTETEAEEEEREFKEAFPSFEGQFDDLEGPNLNTNPTKDKESKRNTKEEFGTLTPELLAEVSQVEKLLYTALVSTKWRRPQLSLPSAQSLTPFLLRYRVFGTILTSLGPVFGSSVDRETIGAHVLFNHATCASLKEMPTTVLVPRPYDIYRDANSQEALKMRPLLDAMKERVEELLAQWPSHPTLLLLNKVITRILTFPVTSPLMKLVVGLETLLGKAQEWERNAHSGVSLMQHLEAITHLIIAWRKLELQAWRHCLDTVTAKVRTQALIHWWGHTRSLVESIASPQQMEEVAGESQFDSKRLLETLKQFMESGVMGDFKTRLDLLESLHCQATLLPPSGSRDVLLAYSWNLLQYYDQFEEHVTSTINKARKPIEKQVKDYVKIARWNDINFYAVQESVTKSHRTLHKHMRAWEKVLRQPVASVLRDTTANKDVGEGQAHLGEWDLKPRQGVHVMKCTPLYGTVQNVEGSSEGSVLSRLGVLSARSRKYITRVLATLPYPGHLESVEDLTEDIISTYQQLQEEASQAETVGNQEKRLKILKSVVKRRRDGLSDLFRALSDMGVSYTKGNSSWRENDLDKAFRLPPLDVAVAHEGQSSLTEAWTGCNKYFYRSVARYALLTTSLQQPSRELGPEIIKKLTGIARHFLLVATKQRSELASFSDKTRSLRQLLSSLDSSVPVKHSRNKSAALARELHALCASLTLTLNEVLLLMNTRPDSSPLVTVSGESSGPDALAVFEVKETIQGVLPELRQVISVLNRQFMFRAEDEDTIPQMMTIRVAEDLTISFDVVKNVASQVSCIISKLSPQEEEGNLCGVQTLLQWLKEWRKISEGFGQWQTETHAPLDKDSPSAVVDTLEDCVTRALLGIERVYKRHCSGRGSTQGEEEQEQVKALLTGATIGSLSSDFKALRLNEVLQCLTNMMTTIQEHELPHDPEIFTTCTPLLRQYSDLCLAILHLQVASHRSLTKMLSVLLVIFENLALKGFCTPQELQDDQGGEGKANKFEDAEGTGLGEGEGKKDKSDQLESEDQLESALQEGESEKAGDQNMEEDDGVEMSEDFEGKMQDVERGEENEDDDEDKDEDEDLDKQMGETEKGADKLDEKMWGDENEDEGDDEEEKQDEEQGPGDGEKTDSQMVAKDDNKDQREGNKDKKEELEEMEDTREINEMQEEGEDYGDDFQDPYGGNPEGDENEDEEQMQLPDDMALDEDEGKDQEDDPGQDDPLEIEEKGLFPEEEREKKEKEEREKSEEEEQGEGKDELAEKEEEEEKEDEEGEETKKDDKKRGIEEGDEEEKTEEKEEEEKKAEEEEDKAEASKDKKSEEPVEAAEMDTNEASKDQTKEDTQAETAGQQEEDPEEKQDEQGEVGEKTEDVEGVGQSEAKTRDEAHEGTTSKLITTTDEAKDEDVQDEEKPRKPGRPDEQRSLGKTKEEVHRGLMTKDRRKNEKEDGDEEEKQEEDKEKEIDKIEEPEAQERDADEYEHVAHAEDQFDKQMVDAATQEQAEEQPAPLQEQEDKDEEQQGQIDEPMEVDETDSQDVEDKALRQEQPEDEAGQDKKRRKQERTGRQQEAQQDTETKVETEGETILEATVQRGPGTTHHTLDLEDDSSMDDDLAWGSLEERQQEMSDTVMQWRGSRSDAEGAARWSQHESRVSSLANHLCEQLRLILEPTQASKLKGDFRTGKRLNMRKVIPYIASEFRKDKIWLRRTQPNKRTYQILLAVDDSESMAEVKAQTLAYESVALVTKALTLLEAGEVGVVSFGSKTQLLHPFHEPFGEESGASVLTRLTFEQKETNFARMLEDSVAMFLNARAHQGHTVGNPDLAQLLLIISDGQTHARSKAVRAAVKAARENRIFVVFVVLDAMDNEYSFYDVLVWEDGAMTPLVQTFPFPFFLVVRDVTTLPDALATALRQWFELVTAEAH
ncbi:midasin isoform X2 [Oratosquilla oratoria]|uniref:midasin isoform X2 n=1 Tax=Oratosquilla oratoria TaxID=337810 RepID=UPI003F764C9F